MTSLLKHVDLGQPWLIASVGTVLFNPIFWNIVARNGKSVTLPAGLPPLPVFSSSSSWASLSDYCGSKLTGETGIMTNRIQEQIPHQDLRFALQRDRLFGDYHLLAWYLPGLGVSPFISFCEKKTEKKTNADHISSHCCASDIIATTRPCSRNPLPWVSRTS